MNSFDIKSIILLFFVFLVKLLFFKFDVRVIFGYSSSMGRVIAIFSVAILFVNLSLNFAGEAFAQGTGNAIASNNSGIAVYIQVLDKKVVEGDIVSLSPKGYILSNRAYDPNIFGVVVKDPAVAFESSQANSYPVVSEGKVLMRVSTVSGKIKKGDLLTSSTKPGLGQKATESGFVVATALEDYGDSKEGKIFVVLSVGNGTVSTDTKGNLLKTFNYLLSAPYLSPMGALRYLFAAIMVILSFVVAVGYFGRVSSLGIEALGRNPLAGKMILFSILIHVLLALVIVGVGIVVAYLALVI